MTTLKDVAARAGVSIITVSRVVNNKGPVKAETRVRIEQAIKELDYYPNSIAQSLNRGLTHTVALVSPKSFGLPLYENFYVMTLQAGIEMKARELGWDLLVTTDDDRGGSFDFLRVWHQRKVDGLIFVGLKPFPPEQIAEIESKGIPCVALSDRISGGRIDWIDTDNETAATDAVVRLSGLGHRHIAFIGPDETIDYIPSIAARAKAIRETCGKLGLSLDLYCEGGMKQSVENAARRFQSAPARPSGIIAANDSIALRFLSLASRAGFGCPHDFSIVGFDAEPEGGRTVPRLASYRQPLLAMGQEAVELLVARLATPDSDKNETVHPLEFVPGESVGFFAGR